MRGEDGKRVGEMTYTTAVHSAIIIDNTEVDKALRGQELSDAQARDKS